MQINFSQRLFIFFPGLLCLLVGSAAYGQLPAYVPADNLVAWYGFNGNATDASANAYNGTAVAVTPAADRSGNSDGAYFFNGSESEIVVPFSDAFNAFPFTVSLWCKLEADENGSMIIQRYTNSSWSGWVMSVSGTDAPTQTISPGYMLQAPPNCNGVVSDAQCGTGINYSGDVYDHLWHMLTFTLDGDSGRFYMDGTLRTVQAWAGPSGATEGATDLRIGGTDMGAPFFFHGALDDVGVWNRTLTSEEVATLYNTLPLVAGCTNTNACNYAPEAIVNDGSCVFDCAGCIDPCACNYNQNAAFNDGSCDYSCNMGMTFITVFHDANANGIFDSGENPMQYWPVQIVELQKTVYTDDAGMIIVPLPIGVVHYQLVNDLPEWISTTPPQIELMVPGNTQAFFGLQHITGMASAEAEELPGYYAYMHCEHGLESGVYVRNTGGQTLHGSLTLTCDPQFTPSMPLSMSTPPNVSGPGFAQWNIQGLESWETRLLAFHVAGPGSEWDGLAMGYLLELELRDVLETVVYTNSFNTLKDIRCEEQPARLQSDPIGVDDAFHYVPQGSIITFRVQFQNNTSEWAEDVLVIQNLNSQQFDITSFELVYASEEVVGCLHDDGTIDLQFSDLVVAPTDVDATRSGGYAVYRARLREDIPADSTFYHNMHVVYDLNNTNGGDSVYHTIYDCSRLAHVIGDEVFCEGDTVVLQSNGVWIDDYRWLLGDTLLSTESQLNLTFDPGFYNVVCQFSNPVCYVCEHKPIHIMEAPEGNVVMENGQLICTGDYSCQWYWNGEPISGAMQNSVTTDDSGVYQVLWTSPEGCTAYSEQYVINSVIEQAVELSVFPNPAINEARVMLPQGVYDLFIYDSSGRALIRQQNFNTLNSIDLTALTTGVYTIVAVQPGVVYRGLLSVR
jgi:hypothetical protein